jgi:hypothetical protein
LCLAGEGGQLQDGVVTNEHHAVVGSHHTAELFKLLTRALLKSLRLADPRRYVREFMLILPLSSSPPRGVRDAGLGGIGTVTHSALG